MESQDERAQRAVEEVLKINSIKELDEQVGELTPEEKAYLDSLDLKSPLTEEERSKLGPDFVERVIQKTLDRLPKRTSPK